MLQNLSRGQTTQNQRTTEPPDDEPTLEERRERLRRSLGISSLENTFANFKPVKGTEKALAAFKTLAQGKPRRKMLLCYGGVGNGKTHLCEATVIALYKSGIFCRVLTMARIMRALKESMGREAMATYDELLEGYCYAQHLIIDDVGMGGSGSEWEFGQLEEIIVARYRERLFTILVSNLDIKPEPNYPKIPFIPERIVSRFRDPDMGMVILNQGADYRRLKGQ